jgi:hypothetical protein
VEFREQQTGEVTKAASNPSNGGFSLHLPEGHYEVKQGLVHRSLTVLPGGSYEVDLRSGHVLDFKVTSKALDNGEVEVRVTAEGAGKHKFALRTDNLIVKRQVSEDGVTPPLDAQEVDLTSGKQEVVWHARVMSSKTPWVAVVVPDDNLSERKEVTGTKSSNN